MLAVQDGSIKHAFLRLMPIILLYLGDFAPGQYRMIYAAKWSRKDDF